MRWEEKGGPAGVEAANGEGVDPLIRNPSQPNDWSRICLLLLCRFCCLWPQKLFGGYGWLHPLFHASSSCKVHCVWASPPTLQHPWPHCPRDLKIRQPRIQLRQLPPEGPLGLGWCHLAEAFMPRLPHAGRPKKARVAKPF